MSEGKKAEGMGEDPICCTKAERVAVFYLSVPCAHILKKHKSTDLERVMTEQQTSQ